VTQWKAMLITDGVKTIWRCNGKIRPTRDETTEYETAGHNYVCEANGSTGLKHVKYIWAWKVEAAGSLEMLTPIYQTTPISTVSGFRPSNLTQIYLGWKGLCVPSLHLVGTAPLTLNFATRQTWVVTWLVNFNKQTNIPRCW